MTGPYVGNVNYAPGGVTVSPYVVDLELLNSTGGGFTQAGVTLKQGQGILLIGTPLVKDGSTSTYVAAAHNATVVEGFLRATTDTGTSGTDLPRFGNLVRIGDVKYSLVKAANGGSDLTSGAMSSLNGRLDTIRDSFIF